jgi:hypothetical protein
LMQFPCNPLAREWIDEIVSNIVTAQPVAAC